MENKKELKANNLIIEIREIVPQMKTKNQSFNLEFIKILRQG